MLVCASRSTVRHIMTLSTLPLFLSKNVLEMTCSLYVPLTSLYLQYGLVSVGLSWPNVSSLRWLGT